MTVTGTPGTGTLTLNAAFSTAYCTFAEAGVLNADVVSYVLEDGNDFEIGTGTYTSSGTTLSRDTVRLSKEAGTAGTAKITASSASNVFLMPAREDYIFGSGVDNRVVRWNGTSDVQSNGSWSIDDSGFMNNTAGTADRFLHVTDSVAVNGFQPPLRLTTEATAPGTGIATGIEFEVETSSGNNEVAYTIEPTFMGGALTEETFDVIHRVMGPGDGGSGGGSLFQHTRMQYDGSLVVGFPGHTGVSPFGSSTIQAANQGSWWAARLATYSGTAFGPFIAFTHTRHATDPDDKTTAVQLDDYIGGLDFYGASGNQFRRVAGLIARIDEAPSTTSMPGRLEFTTTASGAVDPTTRLMIVKDGSTKPLYRILEKENNLTDAANVTLNASLGNTFKLVAAGNRQIDAPTVKPASGEVQKIVIMHTASGADRTLTLQTGVAGGFRFGTDITALTATTSGLTDYIGAIYNDAADRWDVVSYSKGY